MSGSWGQTNFEPSRPYVNEGAAEAERRFGKPTEAPAAPAVAPPQADDSAPTAAWVPRTHPTVVFAKHNKRGLALLEQLPEYVKATAIADRADELIKAQRTQSVQQFQMPDTVNEVTEEWIESDVRRRTETVAVRHRAQTLKELSFTAREAATTAVEQGAVKLVTLLDGQLQDFVARLTDLVGQLGDNVVSASDAIDADVASVWKQIGQMAPEYADIRSVQQALYRTDTLFFEKHSMGDGSYGDPEAKLYFHRNLNEAAPHWRGYINGNGEQMPPEVPWPSDQTEFLVWSIRKNLGMWCPTPKQAEEAAGALGPLAGMREYQERKGFKPQREDQSTTISVPWGR